MCCRRVLWFLQHGRRQKHSALRAQGWQRLHHRLTRSAWSASCLHCAAVCGASGSSAHSCTAAGRSCCKGRRQGSGAALAQALGATPCTQLHFLDRPALSLAHALLSLLRQAARQALAPPAAHLLGYAALENGRLSQLPQRIPCAVLHSRESSKHGTHSGTRTWLAGCAAKARGLAGQLNPDRC